MCGEPAEPDRWFTNEQAEYIQGVGMPTMMREAESILDDAFKGLNSPYLKVSKTGHLDAPAEPDALVEPNDDMIIVSSACHPYEPVKIRRDLATAQLHCLVCGARFAL
jgi:hypothetical protein